MNPITKNEILRRISNGNCYVFIGGFANSGKTTLIREIEQAGFPVFSTSREMHRIADLLTGSTFDTKLPENRQRFIDMIEKGLVPAFGREAIATVAMAAALRRKALEGGSLVVESIGGDELVYMCQQIHVPSSNSTLSPLVTIDVRSSLEQPEVDIRELGSETLEPLREDLLHRRLDLQSFTYRWED
jgi:hypothetical protein